MQIEVPDLYGSPYMHLFHWRSDRGEMFALFADRETADKYVEANPEGGDVLISEVISLPVIDRMGV
jgi:hypothetical protein